MKIIGLTGGIGSGKTTVSQIFAEMGVPVFCCDDVARKIQDTDPRAISGMKRLLGDDIYADDGVHRICRPEYARCTQFTHPSIGT